MTEKIQIKLVKLKSNVIIPTYETNGSSGVDLCSNAKEDVIIKPKQTILIPTGLAIEVPLGYEAQIRSRSGMVLKHGIVVMNSPGTIDSDYRGEIKIILHNMSEKEFTVTSGTRIAQMVICPIVQAIFSETETISETKRNSGGFGSTGLK